MLLRAIDNALPEIGYVVSLDYADRRDRRATTRDEDDRRIRQQSMISG